MNRHAHGLMYRGKKTHNLHVYCTRLYYNRKGHLQHTERLNSKSNPLGGGDELKRDFSKMHMSLTWERGKGEKVTIHEKYFFYSNWHPLQYKVPFEWMNIYISTKIWKGYECLDGGLCAVV